MQVTGLERNLTPFSKRETYMARPSPSLQVSSINSSGLEILIGQGYPSELNTSHSYETAWNSGVCL